MLPEPEVSFGPAAHSQACPPKPYTGLLHGCARLPCWRSTSGRPAEWQSRMRRRCVPSTCCTWPTCARWWGRKVRGRQRRGLRIRQCRGPPNGPVGRQTSRPRPGIRSRCRIDHGTCTLLLHIVVRSRCCDARCRSAVLRALPSAFDEVHDVTNSYPYDQVFEHSENVKCTGLTAS